MSRILLKMAKRSLRVVEPLPNVDLTLWPSLSTLKEQKPSVLVVTWSLSGLRPFRPGHVRFYSLAPDEVPMNHRLALALR
jgi:hypothetical protein